MTSSWPGSRLPATWESPIPRTRHLLHGTRLDPLQGNCVARVQLQRSVEGREGRGAVSLSGENRADERMGAGQRRVQLEAVPCSLHCLAEVSGLRCGIDFKLGYSPERINPGDTKHRLETITKVVAAQDAESLQRIADVYGTLVHAGVHRAPTIRVAEAAKVIENTQRDVNIALMNGSLSFVIASTSRPAM